MQPQFTTYKQWHSTFIIKLISINSEATSIDYVQAVAQHSQNQTNQYNSDATLIYYAQAVAQHFHNQSYQYQLQCNLDSLCTSSGTALLQLVQSVSTPNPPCFTTYLNTSNGKAVLQLIQSVSTLKQPRFTTYFDTSTSKAVS